MTDVLGNIQTYKKHRFTLLKKERKALLLLSEVAGTRVLYWLEFQFIYYLAEKRERKINDR